MKCVPTLDVIMPTRVGVTKPGIVAAGLDIPNRTPAYLKHRICVSVELRSG